MKLVNLIAFVYSFAAMFVVVGLAYLVVVGVVAMLVVAVGMSAKREGRAARFGWLDAVTLLLPILVYVSLAYLVEDRQGINWWLADVIIAAPVCLGLLTRPWIPKRGMWLWALLVASAGTAMAYVAWSEVPRVNLHMRMF